LGFLAAGPAAAVFGVAIGAVAGYSSEQSQLDQSRSVDAPGFNPTAEIGAIPPFGYWDPAGIMKRNLDGEYYSFEWKDRETFEYYRAAELKHGRLAMVALTGMLTAAFVRFPTSQFAYAPDGLSVSESNAAAGIGIIFLLAGFVELENGDGKFEDPANLVGGDFLYLEKGFDGYSEDLRNKELAHGRLAMSTVFTLWLYEYGAGMSPTTLIRTPQPILAVGVILLLTTWSQYYVDIYEEGNPTPVLAASEEKAALPAGSPANAALPEAADSPSGGSLITKVDIDGNTVYRFRDP
jgi:light-harvesting complex I chlorophyll a/b binding protein 1